VSLFSSNRLEKQVAQLSQRGRGRAAGWVSFGQKWKTIQVYIQPLRRNRPTKLSNSVK